jgi:putative phage-type endonuclease
MSLTPEQKAMRRNGVGGSEVAAILGLNPFMSPIDVWLSKVENYEREVTPDMERGTFLEDGVARWYAARTGTEVREVGTLVHPTHPRVLCTPDRIFNNALGESRLLSIKVPGNWLSEEWGEPHAWTVPTGYYVQLQYEMAVCRALALCKTDFAHLAAPLSGNLEILPVVGDERVQERLIEEVGAWWVRHIERREPPPLDGSESAKQWLRRRFPKSEKPVRVATPSEDLLALELQAAEVAWEAADKAYEKARQPVEEAIGDAEGIEGPFGRITFCTNARGVRSLKPIWATKGTPS